jgi:NTP pyrophosphatase (non-canonical NTP hydrolase)
VTPAAFREVVRAISPGLSAYKLGRIERAYEAAAAPLLAANTRLTGELGAVLSSHAVAVPMLLFCPRCAEQHVDAPQPEKGWENPPHRSHLCGACGHVWRPADVATTGVQVLDTAGARDGSPRPEIGLAIRQHEERERQATAWLNDQGAPEVDACGDQLSTLGRMKGLWGKLSGAVRRAGFDVLRTSGSWSIYDVSKAGELELERTNRILSQNVDLIGVVRKCAARFREYALLHARKTPCPTWNPISPRSSSPDEDACAYCGRYKEEHDPANAKRVAEKVTRNREMAELCERALEVAASTEKPARCKCPGPPLCVGCNHHATAPEPGYQQQVVEWMLACFGLEVSVDRVERVHRFIEESLELAQAIGGSADDAHKLVDYVFGRPLGEPRQEVGGVLVTLAALCNAMAIDMEAAGQAELDRVWTKIDRIREKQRKKPHGSPLPGAVDDDGPHRIATVSDEEIPL